MARVNIRSFCGWNEMVATGDTWVARFPFFSFPIGRTANNRFLFYMSTPGRVPKRTSCGRQWLSDAVLRAQHMNGVLMRDRSPRQRWYDVNWRSGEPVQRPMDWYVDLTSELEGVWRASETQLGSCRSCRTDIFPLFVRNECAYECACLGRSRPTNMAVR